MKRLIIVTGCLVFLGVSCNRGGAAAEDYPSWKEQLNKELTLLGHRNWILVVDKAFPMQNAKGMEIINTNEELIPVLQYTLDKIKGSAHVKPLVFTDRELNYITETAAPGIDNYRLQLSSVLGDLPVQHLLHDSVFIKMSASSELFKVLVLKTNATLAYSSVFVQLDCAYWTAGREKQLRDSMNESVR